MILLINTATTYKGGGLQVAQSFINDCKKFTENKYHIILSPSLAQLIKTEEYKSNFHFYNIDYRPATKVFSLTSHDKFFKDLEEKIKPDVVFTTRPCVLETKSSTCYWLQSGTSYILRFTLFQFTFIL